MNVNNQHLEDDIELTFNSLDKINRAEAPDFFYTRLTGRMARRAQEQGSGFFGFVTRPVITAGMLVVFLALNLFMLKHARNGHAAGSTRLSAQEQLAGEYGLSENTIYSETE